MPKASADINKLSSLILLTNDDILLTSGTMRKTFKSLKDLSLPKMLLIQTPHHGSWKNIDDQFWVKQKKIEKFPAFFCRR